MEAALCIARLCCDLAAHSRMLRLLMGAPGDWREALQQAGNVAGGGSSGSGRFGASRGGLHVPASATLKCVMLASQMGCQGFGSFWQGFGSFRQGFALLGPHVHTLRVLVFGDLHLHCKGHEGLHLVGNWVCVR